MSEFPFKNRFEGWTATAAWSYEERITTWKLERNGETRFLKVLPLGFYPSLADERERLEWLQERLPVPTVLDYGIDDGIEWLLTDLLPGRSAFEDEYRTEPERIVPLLAQGLHEIHALPAEECPFDFRLDAALAHVRARHAVGKFDADYDWHEEFAHLTGEAAVTLLDEMRPTSEDVVVCHGDYCFPNVLLEDWRIVGYLDVGELGIADRWWDLAVATWSVTWNLGPGWEDLFLESYGVERDEERQTFYRLLYSLAS